MTIPFGQTLAIIDSDKRAVPAFYRFLTELANTTTDTTTAVELAALAARVLALEGQEADTVIGIGAIKAYKVGGAWNVALDGDSANLMRGLVYGTGSNGRRWLSVAEVFQPGSDFIVNDSGYLLKGILASIASLPAVGNTLNDAYRVESVLWYWNGTAWIADANASGVLAITLATVPDIGGGTLQKTQFDTKGRKTGTSAATTDDLTEGASNLYFTAQRVRDALLTGLSTATNAVIAATDSVVVAFGKLQAQISANLTALGLKADKTITIATTAPLTGGGDLSANRTLAIPAATASVAGHMTAAYASKLDGVATGATAYTDANAQAAVVIDSIADADTTHAPSRNAVFDALALKADSSKLADGTYTPTTTLGTNASAATASVWQWMRVGNTVTASGYVSVTPTVGSGITVVYLSLPVASNFTAQAQCVGSGSAAYTPYAPALIVASTALDAIQVTFTAQSTSAVSVYMTCTYRII